MGAEDAALPEHGIHQGGIPRRGGRAGQNSGVLGQLSGVLVQNSGVLGEISGVLAQITGVLVQNSGVLGWNSGVLVQNTSVLGEISGVLDQNTGELGLNTTSVEGLDGGRPVRNSIKPRRFGCRAGARRSRGKTKALASASHTRRRLRIRQLLQPPSVPVLLNQPPRLGQRHPVAEETAPIESDVRGNSPPIDQPSAARQSPPIRSRLRGFRDRADQGRSVGRGRVSAWPLKTACLAWRADVSSRPPELALRERWNRRSGPPE